MTTPEQRAARDTVRQQLETAFHHLDVLTTPSARHIVLHDLPRLTWFVGPNGSGKSQALQAIYEHLGTFRDRSILSTVALVSDTRVHAGLLPNDTLGVSDYSHRSGTADVSASLTTAIALLQDDASLELEVRAIAQHILQRELRLDFGANGLLRPRSRDPRTAALYEFTSEGRGVLELITLLTYAHTNRFDVLLIDEPEVGLHPQHQALLLEELRRSGKRVVLATHSPYMLNVRNIDDLRGMVCFHADGSAPSQATVPPGTDWGGLLPHLGEDRSTFFFSEAPVFCEGDSDALLLTELCRQLGRGVAPGGAPISMGGVIQVFKMLSLAHALGKPASAIVDQDAILRRELCAVADPVPAYQTALQAQNTTGEHLRANLIAQIDALLGAVQTAHSGSALAQRLNGAQMNADKQRVALLEAVTNADPDLQAHSLNSAVNAVTTTFETYRRLLALARVHVLPRGSLERHVPGHGIGGKNQVLAAELTWLRTPSATKTADTRMRYSDLVSIIETLPMRPAVDLETQLRIVMSDILNTLLPALFDGHWTQTTDLEELRTYFRSDSVRRAYDQLCSVSAVQIESSQAFNLQLRVRLAGGQLWRLDFDQNTNPANRAMLRLIAE